MNQRRLFRDRVIQLNDSINPRADVPALIIRHNAIGLAVDQHDPIDASKARIRVAASKGWPPRAA